MTQLELSPPQRRVSFWAVFALATFLCFGASLAFVLVAPTLNLSAVGAVLTVVLGIVAMFLLAHFTALSEIFLLSIFAGFMLLLAGGLSMLRLLGWW